MWPSQLRRSRTGRERHAVGPARAPPSILGPALGRGYVLRYDMVFVPRQPLSADLLGLGAQTPRAVPSDLVVALATHVVPGAGGPEGGPAGHPRRGRYRGGPRRTAHADRAAWPRGWPTSGRRTSASACCSGQWAVLIGYAGLPWVLASAVRLGRDGRGWAACTIALAVGRARRRCGLGARRAGGTRRGRHRGRRVRAGDPPARVGRRLRGGGGAALGGPGSDPTGRSAWECTGSNGFRAVGRHCRSGRSPAC